MISPVDYRSTYVTIAAANELSLPEWAMRAQSEDYIDQDLFKFTSRRKKSQMLTPPQLWNGWLSEVRSSMEGFGDVAKEMLQSNTEIDTNIL